MEHLKPKEQTLLLSFSFFNQEKWQTFNFNTWKSLNLEALCACPWACKGRTNPMRILRTKEGELVL